MSDEIKMLREALANCSARQVRLQNAISEALCDLDTIPYEAGTPVACVYEGLRRALEPVLSDEKEASDA